MVSVILKIAVAIIAICVSFIPGVIEGLCLALQSRFQYAAAFDVIKVLIP